MLPFSSQHTFAFEHATRKPSTGVHDSKVCPHQAQRPRRQDLGGPAHSGLESPFLLGVTGHPVTFRLTGSLSGRAHTAFLSQRAQAGPSGQLCRTALLRGEPVSLLYFLRTFSPHSFSPAA